MRGTSQHLQILKTFGHTGIDLGYLYSEIEEKFLPSSRLWPAEHIEENRKKVYHPKQRTFWTSKQTPKEKLKDLDLDITGSVGLAIPSAVGTVKASATLKYIQKNEVVFFRCKATRKDILSSFDLILSND